MALQQLSSSQANPEVIINENFEAMEAAATFAKRHAVTTGLTWGYYGGLYNGNTIADGTVTLTNTSDNYVVVLRSTGVVSTSTTSTNSTNTLYAKLYKVTCAGGVATTVVDQRWDANGLLFAPGSAGGSFQPLDADLTAIAGLTSAADKIPYFTGSAAASLLTRDTDGTLAANSDTVLATQKAVKTYVDHVQTTTALSINTGVVDIDCSLGDYFTLALSANVTSFTFSNKPGSGKGFSKWVEITQHASSAKTVTLSQFTWAGGIGSTAVSTALSAVDVLAITSVDNGTTLRATLAKAFA